MLYYDVISILIVQFLPFLNEIIALFHLHISSI